MKTVKTLTSSLACHLHAHHHRCESAILTKGIQEKREKCRKGVLSTQVNDVHCPANGYGGPRLEPAVQNVEWLSISSGVGRNVHLYCL